MSQATLTREAPVGQTTFPVVEVFGPTVQGEGAEAGVVTHFVRLGGCDFRCSWCDTMYAVDPAAVRAGARRLSAQRIIEEIEGLKGSPSWVTLSGGNPALHELETLVVDLQTCGYRVAVETQGSLWRDWLGMVERLTVSPKPPSSGMATPNHASQFEDFMARALAGGRTATVIKIVCFDEADLAWAKSTATRWPEVPLFLSAGTPVASEGPVRETVGDAYRWLCESVAADGALASARVLPQLHVIAWERATGV